MTAHRSGTQTATTKNTTGEGKMECILAEDNNLLKKPVPGILQSRERRAGVHLVLFDE